jgi:hypothetical protein
LISKEKGQKNIRVMKIKEYLKQNFFIDAYLKSKRIARWKKNGYNIPVPHDIKQLAILYYAMAYKLEILVETGTYLGDMIWAQKDYFRKIYSIELSEQLFIKAKKRFKNKSQVKLIQGDSSEKINQILNEIQSPALLWLDGHYSGGITAKGNKACPIYAELNQIFNSPFSHLVLIDDARLFTGENDYPKLEELKTFVYSNSDYNMKVENDIILLSKINDRV